MKHPVNIELLTGNKLITIQPSHITVKWQKMTTNQEKQIVETIKKVMVNNNYRIAYEEAVKMAKEMKITERADFFPFIFALDIRGEKADEFMNYVLGINENKIYRVQLVFDDTIALYENDKITVYATENEQDAKRVFEKLSENKNLKYILK